MIQRCHNSPASFAKCGLAVLMLGLLSACGGSVQEALGGGARAPDEFQVVRRAPLVLPPDYNLRPPGQVQGVVRRSTAEDAKEIITGSTDASPGDQSAGEKALLAAASVQADPDVRAKLLDENTELTQIDESSFLFLLDWQREGLTYADAVIDPDEEAERLLVEGKARRVTTRRVSSETVTPGGS